jgi:hypothetical protein
VARPPEDRVVLHGLQIPGLIFMRRWRHQTPDHLIRRKGEEHTDPKRQERHQPSRNHRLVITG